MILGLSPMDGVTDVAMRYMVAKYSHPDLIFTEFVSVDALHHAKDERRERLLRTLLRVKDLQCHGDTVPQWHSRPGNVWPREIAQVFGKNIEYFKEAAELIESLGFDGIDINMGCPMHKVEDQGSGAGLIRTPRLAQEIINAVKSATKLPVSVKTRIGVDRDIAEEWMETLMEVSSAMISLHGRTLRQLYSGSADWEAIGRAAQVVHKYGGVILGNGDVESRDKAQMLSDKYGVDGVLIGRAAEGNPGIFLQGSVLCNVCSEQRTDPCIHMRFAWMVEHTKIFESVFAERVDPLKSNITLKDQPSKWFFPMRKHLAWYCRGFPGAAELRAKLMLTNSSSEVESVISGYLT